MIAGDASTIYQGSPVIAAAGYVDASTAGAVPNMGAFWGCFYVDPTTLKPTFKNYYPGSITPPSSAKILKLLFMTVLIKCLKFNQTMTVRQHKRMYFRMQTGYRQLAGSTLNGVSSAELDDSTIAASSDAAAQLLIIGVSRDPKNSDLTAANVNWRVLVNHAHIWSRCRHCRSWIRSNYGYITTTTS